MTTKKQGHQSIGDFYQQFQAHVHMCEEMGVQLYEPALATSIMPERGGTIVTEDNAVHPSLWSWRIPTTST